MDFWSYFWLMVWAFFFIAYLMVLFNILLDLFRDHELSGWWKAVWVIFLLVFPAITALVYLIARGSGMARRAVARQAEAQQEAESYIRSVATTSPAEQIARAKELKDSGAISQEEFDALKAKALS